MTTDGSAGEITGTGRRRPRGAVRDGLVAAGLELARAGGPDAVVLREATQMVGVVPNAAYRHFPGRDELLAAVAAAAMRELAPRMAPGLAPGRAAPAGGGAGPPAPQRSRPPQRDVPLVRRRGALGGAEAPPPGNCRPAPAGAPPPPPRPPPPPKPATRPAGPYRRAARRRSSS